MLMCLLVHANSTNKQLIYVQTHSVNPHNLSYAALINFNVCKIISHAPYQVLVSIIP